MRKLIIMNGIPGSGKNTIGKMISIEEEGIFLGYGDIESDYDRRYVETHAGEEFDLEGENLFGIIRVDAYNKLINTALEKALKGNTVVMCAPFYERLLKPSHILEIQDKGHSYDVEVEFVWVNIEFEKTRDRLIAKSNVNDTWRLNNWNRYTEMVRNIIPDYEFNYTSRDIRYPSIDMKYFEIHDNNDYIEVPDEIQNFRKEQAEYIMVTA